MQVSELIKELETAINKHGDLDISVWVSVIEFDDTSLYDGEYSMWAEPVKREGEYRFVISAHA